MFRRATRLAGAIALAALISFHLQGCGGTTAGLAALASGGGGGGGGGTPTAVTDVVIDRLEARTSPVPIQFRLLGNPGLLEVSFGYLLPGDPTVHAMTVATDASSRNKLDLQAGPAPGILHTVEWDLEADLGARYRQGVIVEISASGAPRRTNALAVGNDPPAIERLDLLLQDEETEGVVAFVIELSDDAGDPFLDLRVTYDVIGDAEGFLPARSATLPREEATPEVTLELVPTDRPVSFLWDSKSQLAGREVEVVLRFIPEDESTEGIPRNSSVIRVDNNVAPSIVVDAGRFVASPDGHGGVPIFFEVFDGSDDPIDREAPDLVDVLFQWTRVPESYPPLPRDPDALREILASPSARRELQICTEMPRTFRGNLVPAGPTTVRLPELSGTAVSVVETDDATGSTRVRGHLELLRPIAFPDPGHPVDIMGGLRHPIAALPVLDGRKALVLEDTGSAYRLAVVHLVSGRRLRDLVSGSGIPRAMAFEPGARSLVFAIDGPVTDSWQVRRLRLDCRSPEDQLLFATDGTFHPGQIRGIASLGAAACAITVGQSLVRLDYPEGQTARGKEIAGPGRGSALVLPWGLTPDISGPERVLMAERGRDRILAVDLADGSMAPIPLLSPGVSGPTALALDPRGRRLLAITENGDGTRALQAIHLGPAPDPDRDGIGDPRPVTLFPIDPGGAGYTNEVGAVATGEAGLILLSLPGDNILLAGGGIQQRRRILPSEDDYDGFTATVTVDRPFDPLPVPNQPYRLVDSVSRIIGSPGGTFATFVWDTADVAPSGQVHVQGIVLDTDTSPPSDTRTAVIPKTLLGQLQTTPLVLGDATTTPEPADVAMGDLDGDGDVDIAVVDAVANHVAVFFQNAAGEFDSPPLLLPDPDMDLQRFGATIDIVDFDEDGDLDIVAANRKTGVIGGSNLGVVCHMQVGPRTFEGRLVLEANSASELLAGDLDGDQRIDLLTYREEQPTLSIYLQNLDGSFSPAASRTIRLPSGPNTPITIGSVDLADINGDGLLDILSASYLTGVGMGGNRSRIFVHQQRPVSEGGGFSGLLVADFIDLVVGSAAAGDVDGDGDQDIVYSLGFSTLNFFRLLRQVESVAFQESTLLPVTALGRLRLADINDDGRLDIVDSANRAFLQTVNGEFAPTKQNLADAMASPTSTYEIGDVDGDGDQDLLLVEAQEVRLYRSPSAGDFSLDVVYLDDPEDPDQPDDYDPVAVEALDFDGDEDLDLIVVNGSLSNPARGRLLLYEQTSPRTFAEPRAVAVAANIGSVTQLLARDIDGDGRVDLILDAFEGMQLLYGRENGFDAVKPMTSVFPVRFDLADLDHDGDLDLALIDFPDLAIFRQRQPRAFERGRVRLPIPDPEDRPFLIHGTDLNANSRIDIVTVSRSGIVHVYDQAEGGIFGSPRQIASLGSFFASQIYSADLDSDGRTDLVVPLNESISVLYQQRPGTFQEVMLELLPGVPFSFFSRLEIADLDADSDLDLVLNGQVPFFESGPLEVLWQMNRGGRQFDPAVRHLPVEIIPSSQTRTTALLVRDLDGDGILDLVYALNNGGRGDREPFDGGIAIYFGGE